MIAARAVARELIDSSASTFGSERSLTDPELSLAESSEETATKALTKLNPAKRD